jgi:phospholipid/cholesterol/gamma-HCH transport system permease protein
MLGEIGRYTLFMLQVLKLPERWGIFWKQLMDEVDKLVLRSIPIVILISIFMGAVTSIQTAYNITNPFIPMSMVGFTTVTSSILEFSPTIISLILAGKVGSRITSEIGSMRINEQIDALEVMGINSSNFLLLPKLTASVFFNPFVILISMFSATFGGYLVAHLTGIYAPSEYITGIRTEFRAFNIIYAMIKTVTFAFIIASVSGYMGYFVKGGATGLGKASTEAVVWSSIIIILFNLILTQLLLS